MILWYFDNQFIQIHIYLKNIIKRLPIQKLYLFYVHLFTFFSHISHISMGVGCACARTTNKKCVNKTVLYSLRPIVFILYVSINKETYFFFGILFALRLFFVLQPIDIGLGCHQRRRISSNSHQRHNYYLIACSIDDNKRYSKMCRLKYQQFICDNFNICFFLHVIFFFSFWNLKCRNLLSCLCHHIKCYNYHSILLHCVSM